MDVRRAQGAILLVGAVAFYLLLEVADIGFHWTPLVLGLVYLVAAAIGGPGGSYWSTAVVLTVFGLGPVARFEYDLDFSVASIYVVALGLAVLVAGQLAERGFAITQTAVGATILALGIVFSQQGKLDVVDEPLLYAGFLAVVGTARLVTGARSDSRRR